MEIAKVGAKKIFTEGVEKAEKLEKASSVDKTQSIKSLEENHIEISSEAQLHCEALEMVQSAPDVRADRVAELKAKIQSGEYEVDATKLADRMIESHLEADLLEA